MRIDQLKCLADVAVTGSISNTAQRLFLSQQAVSKNIKQLEAEYGAELLKRTHAGVSLTHVGEEVVAFAQSVLAQEATLHEKIEKIQEDIDENVHFAMDIGSASPVTNYVLPNVLARLYAVKKKPSVGIMQIPNQELLVQLLDRETIDLGMVTIKEAELPRILGEYADELVVEILMRDDLTLVTSKRMMLAKGIPLNGNSFANNPIRCLFNIQPVEEIQESLYAANVICSNDVEFHREMLEKTDAIVIMPSLAYRNYFSNAKKYVAAPFVFEHPEKYMTTEFDSPSIVHLAVYRKDAPSMVRNVVEMIRQEINAR